MALRVADSGVGLWLDKLSFNSTQVRDGVQQLISDNNGDFSRNMDRISAALKLAGGAARAADLIEHVAFHGSEHLATFDQQFSWFVFWNLDLLAVWLALLLVMLTCCGGCCAVAQSGKQCTKREKKRHRD